MRQGATHHLWRRGCAVASARWWCWSATMRGRRALDSTWIGLRSSLKSGPELAAWIGHLYSAGAHGRAEIEVLNDLGLLMTLPVLVT